MAIESKQLFTLAVSALVICLVMSFALTSAVFISGCVSDTNNNQNQQTEASGTQTHAGTAVFTITDAAMNMGSVSSVNVTIDKVEINSENKGWIVLSTEELTYDLLKLKAENANELLATANLSAGSYNQVRLRISKVVVVEDRAIKEAKLPSNVLKINAKLDIVENETSVVVFDFIADESLHTTGDGKIIMAPVINVETKTNATVQISAQNRVEIQGGKVNGNVKVGMNENRDVGVGIKLKGNTDLSILGNGKVNIVGTLPSIKNITLNKDKYPANEKIEINVKIDLQGNTDNTQIHIYGITSRQGAHLIDETVDLTEKTQYRFNINAPTCTHGCGARYYPGKYPLTAEIIQNGKVINNLKIDVELY